MTSRSYRDLLVWQKGVELVKAVYALTEQFPKREQYALANQLQRCAVSVPSNIAEGQARGSRKDFRRFLRMSLGSLAEVDTQLEIASQLGYAPKESLSERTELILELRRMLFSLINTLPKD